MALLNKHLDYKRECSHLNWRALIRLFFSFFDQILKGIKSQFTVFSVFSRLIVQVSLFFILINFISNDQIFEKTLQLLGEPLFNKQLIGTESESTIFARDNVE